MSERIIGMNWDRPRASGHREQDFGIGTAPAPASGAGACRSRNGRTERRANRADRPSPRLRRCGDERPRRANRTGRRRTRDFDEPITGNRNCVSSLVHSPMRRLAAIGFATASTPSMTMLPPSGSTTVASISEQRSFFRPRLSRVSRRARRAPPCRSMPRKTGLRGAGRRCAATRRRCNRSGRSKDPRTSSTGAVGVMGIESAHNALAAEMPPLGSLCANPVRRRQVRRDVGSAVPAATTPAPSAALPRSAERDRPISCRAAAPQFAGASSSVTSGGYRYRLSTRTLLLVE